MSEAKTVSFGIGEGFGDLIQTIAQEHLLYNYSFSKAVKTIEESFIGIPREMAVAVVLGNSHIKEDVKTQNVSYIDKEPQGGQSSKLDLNTWASRHFQKLSHSCSTVYSGIYLNFRTIKNATILSADLPNLIRILGDDTYELAARDLVEENEDTDYLMSSIKVIQDLLIEWSKFHKCCIDLCNEGLIDEEYRETPDTVYSLQSMYNGIITNPNYEPNTKQQQELENYLDAQKEIDIVIEKGIKECDPKDKWDAGWISPEGKYYGLNGEIANMLHNNIAEGLLEAGIIPDNDDNRGNPDSYLCEQGWIRQHGNWMLFDGYYRDYNKSITKEQRKVMYVIGQHHHMGILRLGLQMDNISAVSIEHIEDVQFKMKFFAL